MHKPAGWTSFDVVGKLRGLLKWKSVGHAGTLDPAATGLLIVLFGDATKRSAEFTLLEKEYCGVIRFGIRTTSDDLDGDIIECREISNWNFAQIKSVAASFVGDLQQVPPQVSAVKVGGKRSYKLARAGKSVELQARAVNIIEFDLSSEGEPDIGFRIRCSSGTYIRSIARDLGEQLGWGGTLARLERTAIGPYRLENSLTIPEIERRACEFAAV